MYFATLPCTAHARPHGVPARAAPSPVARLAHLARNEARRCADLAAREQARGSRSDRHGICTRGTLRPAGARHPQIAGTAPSEVMMNCRNLIAMLAMAPLACASPNNTQ